MEIHDIQLSPLGLVSMGKAFSYFPRHVSIDDLLAVAAVAATMTVLWSVGLLFPRQDPYLYKMYDRPQKFIATGAAKGTRDVAEKLAQLDAEIVVFFGSQSGTAERFAVRLSKEVRLRFGKKALVADASDYDPASIGHIPSSRMAIFILSTFGEGDPSDNLFDLCGYLDTTKGTPFSNLRYLALGLGNSNYKYYNAVVDAVATKLDSLGGTALLPIARADDANGQTEEHYLDFKTSVFNYVTSHLGFEERDPVFEPSLAIIEDPSLDTIDLYNGEAWAPKRDRTADRIMSSIHSLSVINTRELFQLANGHHCIHMEMDLLDHPELKYKTGDHLGVWPSNPKPEVERLLSSLGRLGSRATPVLLRSLDAETKLKIPTPTTLEALFGSYLEICAAVPRETISTLIQFAPTTSAKEILTRLSNDKATYEQFKDNTYVNLGLLLQYAAPGESAWKDLPLSLVVEILPAMQPRYYSISSSAVVQARQITITAVVSDRKLQGEEVIPGLCTNYLLGVQRSILGTPASADQRIYAHVRKSTFKLPASMAQPIIMVAAGTGIAPFRGFLQERERLLKMGRSIGRTILFFGCRNEGHDFIYREELQNYANLPDLNFSLITAFSRPNDGHKLYVQDRIQQHAHEVCDLIANQEASFYICGSASMARDVSRVIGEEIKSRKSWDDDQLRSFMDQRRRIRRWQQDVWG